MIHLSSDGLTVAAMRLPPLLKTAPHLQMPANTFSTGSSAALEDKCFIQAAFWPSAEAAFEMFVCKRVALARVRSCVPCASF